MNWKAILVVVVMCLSVLLPVAWEWWIRRRRRRFVLARDAALDAFGLNLNVKRKPGETDASYRARLSGALRPGRQ